MEIRYYLSLLRRWWWVLLAGVLIAGVPTYLITDSLTPTYRATATVFVNVSSETAPVYQDVLQSQQLVLTYSQMAEQPVVLDEVRDRLGLDYSLDELQEMISTEPRRDTQLFEISAVGSNPHSIRDIANTTALVFIDQHGAYLPEGQASVLRIAQPALVPQSPIAPDPLRNVVLAVFAGLLVAGFGIMLYEYLDDTVKTPEDLDAAVSVPTLGMITFSEPGRKTDNPEWAGGGFHSPAMEPYRLIRTNLDFASVTEPVKRILLTSGIPAEGKTTTVANLAVVMAQAGRKVALIDADLRKPSLHRIFRLSNYRGLSNLLLQNEIEAQDYLQETDVEGLRVLTSGPLPPNPAELLMSRVLQKTLQSITDDVDIVLIDSPPVLAVADPVILASQVDATVLVIDSRKARPDMVRRSVEMLTKSGTRLVGAILNKLAENPESGYYYYGYYGTPTVGEGSESSLPSTSQPSQTQS